MKSTRLSLAIFTVLSLSLTSTCNKDDSPSSSKPKTCTWHGNCSDKAPEGAYDCDGNQIVTCVAGQWQAVAYCPSFQDSKGYACTCKGGCGTSVIECTYAFNVCGNQSYHTRP